MKQKITKITDIVKAYNLLVKNIDEDASSSSIRAYGGVIRSGKGVLVEGMAKNLIEIAWKNIGGKSSRLSFERNIISVPIQKKYIDTLKEIEVRNYIKSNLEKYVYKFKTDIHVNLDKKLVMGIECKAYTENAMIKRIMVDFTFFKKAHKNASTVLLQLESQLGGDYSDLSKKITYGSFPTHTILSYFDVDLNIITLLEGERRVDKPIHKKSFYKELKINSVERVVKLFKELLKPYL